MFPDVIKKYIEDKNLSVAIFAAMIRVDSQTIYNWIKGVSTIRPSIAMRVEKATRGEIKYEQLTSAPKKKRWMRLKGEQLQFPELK
jgi:DNA-binding transcriptional regulator YdaS (Cro superfamily)